VNFETISTRLCQLSAIFFSLVTKINETSSSSNITQHHLQSFRGAPKESRLGEVNAATKNKNGFTQDSKPDLTSAGRFGNNRPKKNQIER